MQPAAPSTAYYGDEQKFQWHSTWPLLASSVWDASQKEDVLTHRKVTKSLPLSDSRWPVISPVIYVTGEKSIQSRRRGKHFRIWPEFPEKCCKDVNYIVLAEHKEGANTQEETLPDFHIWTRPWKSVTVIVHFQEKCNSEGKLLGLGWAGGDSPSIRNAIRKAKTWDVGNESR